MDSGRFPRLPMGDLDIDLCWTCQGIWFDPHESTQLAPGGVVKLFQNIHGHREGYRPPLATTLRCPRCDASLDYCQDLTKSGRFVYHRCPSEHGRFTSFTQFFIEKGFVRSLTASEIITLKANIRVIRCAGCGAPVDLHQDSVCAYCRSPIAILDSEAVDKTLAAYHQAENARHQIDPKKMNAFILGRSHSSTGSAEATDLLASGLEFLSVFLS